MALDRAQKIYAAAIIVAATVMLALVLTADKYKFDATYCNKSKCEHVEGTITKPECPPKHAGATMVIGTCRFDKAD